MDSKKLTNSSDGVQGHCSEDNRVSARTAHIDLSVCFLGPLSPSNFCMSPALTCRGLVLLVWQTLPTVLPLCPSNLGTTFSAPRFGLKNHILSQGPAAIFSLILREHTNTQISNCRQYTHTQTHTHTHISLSAFSTDTQ